jgi:hypothetical protein
MFNVTENGAQHPAVRVTARPKLVRSGASQQLSVQASTDPFRAMFSATPAARVARISRLLEARQLRA